MHHVDCSKSCWETKKKSLEEAAGGLKDISTGTRVVICYYERAAGVGAISSLTFLLLNLLIIEWKCFGC